MKDMSDAEISLVGQDLCVSQRVHKRSKKTVAPILKDSQLIDVTTQDRLETSSIEIDVVGSDISGHQTKNANISDVAAIVIEAKLKIKCP